jgi:hypothetical protein
MAIVTAIKVSKPKTRFHSYKKSRGKQLKAPAVNKRSSTSENGGGCPCTHSLAKVLTSWARHGDEYSVAAEANQLKCLHGAV